jgi:hypothetical protein
LRHEIEREDALGSCLVAVDVERDAHVEQRALGGTLAAEQLALGQGIDELHERTRRHARPLRLAEHLVEEGAGVVFGESHGDLVPIDC